MFGHICLFYVAVIRYNFFYLHFGKIKIDGAFKFPMNYLLTHSQFGI